MSTSSTSSTSSSSPSPSSSSSSSLSSLSFTFRFLKSIVKQLLTPNPLGNIWKNEKASLAFTNGQLQSDMSSSSSSLDNGPIRVAFRNLSSIPLILCWINDSGELFHFYKLSPCTTTTMTTTTNSNQLIMSSDHVETTSIGHAFCIVHVKDKEKFQQVIDQKKQLFDESCIVLGYQPTATMNHQKNDWLHLVQISQQPSINNNINNSGPYENNNKKEVICCFPTTATTNDNNNDNNDNSTMTDNTDNNNNIISSSSPCIKMEWTLTAQKGYLDKEPYDTTNKVYIPHVISGWKVQLEPNWHDGDESLQERLALDLQVAAKALPSHARNYLQQHVTIWVNHSIKYGSKSCPINGRGCCFHPDRDWLIENGLHPNKVKCVEINSGPGYKKDLNLWGIGGVMIHELSHAYHNLVVPNGYDNKQIKQCYNQAMKEKLYDQVQVHVNNDNDDKDNEDDGDDKTKQVHFKKTIRKAYACTNCMEYFAELSTAFLGGINNNNNNNDNDETCIEFNKWFPFNRQQIQTHDPRAYQMLCQIWKINPKS